MIQITNRNRSAHVLLTGFAAFVLAAGVGSFFWLRSSPETSTVLPPTPNTSAVLQATPLNPTADYPKSLDLGEQMIGANCLAFFIVANRGESDLTVGKFKPSCSCSRVEPVTATGPNPKGQFVVRPGESAKFSVAIRVQGNAGHDMMSTIDFQTNDPKNAEPQITLSIPKLIGGIIVVPSAVVFGTLSRGNKPAKIIDVYDSASPPRPISKIVNAQPQRFSYRVVPASEISSNPPEQGTRNFLTRLEVVPHTSAPGSLDGNLLISLVGRPDAQDCVKILGKVIGFAEIMPSEIMLPRRSAKEFIYFADCLCRGKQGMPLALSTIDAPRHLTVAYFPVESNPSIVRIRVELKDHTMKETTPDPATVKIRVKQSDREEALVLQVHFQPAG